MEKDIEEEVSGTDREILEVLTKSGEKLSTYRIAKEVDVSWSTVNTHLKDLQIEGLVESEKGVSGGKKTRLWWVDQSSLDDFVKK
ncbi:MAG: winged helix-turn-helix transcriptional regulator [Candidatus Aenigmatarchaeota archaeon]